jgi:hypothetical protein
MISSAPYLPCSCQIHALQINLNFAIGQNMWLRSKAKRIAPCRAGFNHNFLMDLLQKSANARVMRTDIPPSSVDSYCKALLIDKNTWPTR